MSTGDLSAVGRTAFAVALARAAEAEREHPWFVDPLAVRLAASVPHATRERVGLGLTAWVAVRTRFLDDVIVRALEHGIRQIVIVGAGLDARAYRLRVPENAVIYELDREDVFAAKRRVAQAAGLVSPARREVVIDVTQPRWLDAVTRVGWRDVEPTLWILEGFLIYFDAPTRTRMLTELADASAPGSELGATVSTRATTTHPLWHPFDDTDTVTWLAGCGWNAEVTSMNEASGRFGRPLSRGVSEHLAGLLINANHDPDSLRDGPTGWS